MRKTIFDALALAAIVALPFVPQAIAARSDIKAAPVFVIEATDADTGEVWTVSVASDCVTAWQYVTGAALPDGDYYMICEER